MADTVDLIKRLRLVIGRPQAVWRNILLYFFSKSMCSRLPSKYLCFPGSSPPLPGPRLCRRTLCPTTITTTALANWGTRPPAAAPDLKDQVIMGALLFTGLVVYRRYWTLLWSLAAGKGSSHSVVKHLIDCFLLISHNPVCWFLVLFLVPLGPIQKVLGLYQLLVTLLLPIRPT